jgi:phosphopantothenoylcysteine synthetase/decarboxylase
MSGPRGVLYLLACGAEPASDLHQLVDLAINAGWDVHVGATPTGTEFIDTEALSTQTGHTVRHTWSGRTSSWPPADAIIVAPATINTINKFAAGIADTWVLSTLIEAMGHNIPIVFATNINPALGRHPRFRHNITELQTWGIPVLWEPEPTPPTWIAPWPDILNHLHRRTSPPDPQQTDA